MSFFLIAFSMQAAVAVGAEPDAVFQKDVDQQPTLVENYPVKLCVGDLSYSGMAKKMEDSRCRKKSDLSYDECMKVETKGRDFTQLIINKTFKVKTGDVVYLRKNMKYSFFTGSGGIVKNFAKEPSSIFSFHTANYGGVALDPVKKCP